MKVAKDGIRSIVHIGYDGRVHKKFRGTNKEERFANEVKVLKVLESRGCDFVPRLLDFNEEDCSIITTNCGAPFESISESKAKELFDALETGFGVVHDDPFPRNITYNDKMGRFCIIDFELAEIKDCPEGGSEKGDETAARTLEWCGLSRAGSRKKGNQDSLSVFSSQQGWAESETLSGKQSIDEEGLIFAVSDGMGGHKGGEVASALVVGELRRFLPAMMGDFRHTAEPLRILGAAVESLHSYITGVGQRRKSEGLDNMGATMVCGLFFRTTVNFAHVGDSRFYRYREGELSQLTFDHSPVGKLFHSGKINEREARMHPARNVLSQAIGGVCQKIKPQVDESSLKPGDWFLICSDGVIDGLWNKHIARAFEEGTEAESVPRKSGKDFSIGHVKKAGRDDTTLLWLR